MLDTFTATFTPPFIVCFKGPILDNQWEQILGIEDKIEIEVTKVHKSKGRSLHNCCFCLKLQK